MLAYVLHSRPYKETSALLSIFSEQGRQTVVLRGARRAKGSKVQLFNLYDVELVGRSELKSLAQFDSVEYVANLVGERLYCGFYLNELLVKLLPELDPYPELFHLYQVALYSLRESSQIEPILRQFEWQLINQLGYSYSLEQDVQGDRIQAKQWYYLNPEAGFIKTQATDSFSGADIISLSQSGWHGASTLFFAKKLMRQTLAFHLKGQPLLSRELFVRHS